MTRGRWLQGGLILACLALGTALLAAALARNLVFFQSPSEIAAAPPPPETVFRLGGRVVSGSASLEAGIHRFRVEDIEGGAETGAGAQLEVAYAGILPPLFAEGEEVILEGRLEEGGGVRALRVFSRHDETYRPLSQGTAGSAGPSGEPGG